MLSKILVTLVLLVVLGGLGAADVLLTGEKPPTKMMADATNSASSTSEASSTSSMVSSASSSSETGIRRKRGPNVRETLTQLQFNFQDTKESNILGMVIPQDVTVESQVILAKKDRAGMIAWTETPKVKQYFLALKEALHSSFSPQVTDLLDETQTRDGKPPRNLLTFLDPGISEERIVFIRIRTRLYEFHIAEGHEETIFNLIEELTQ